jgi:hypothetical protein
LETELETSKNKKVKGTSKKQKEKIGGVTYKLTQNKKIKDKLEEIANSIDSLEKNAIKNLKIALSAYVAGPDEESIKTVLDTELAKIMELLEANKKALLTQ